MDQIQESSSATLNVKFYDENGTLTLPVAVAYRIDCLTNEVAVRVLTAVPPASSLNIPIDPTDSAVIDQDNGVEIRRLTLEAQYGPNQAHNTKYDFVVRNLRFIP